MGKLSKSTPVMIAMRLIYISIVFTSCSCRCSLSRPSSPNAEICVSTCSSRSTCRLHLSQRPLHLSSSVLTVACMSDFSASTCRVECMEIWFASSRVCSRGLHNARLQHQACTVFTDIPSYTDPKNNPGPTKRLDCGLHARLKH